MTLSKKQFMAFFKNYIVAIILLALFFTMSSLFWTTDTAHSRADLDSLSFGWPVSFEYKIRQDFNLSTTNLPPPEVRLPDDIKVKRIEVLFKKGDNLIVGDIDPLERTFTEEHAYIKRYDYDNSTLWYVVNQRGQLPYTEPSNAR